MTSAIASAIAGPGATAQAPPLATMRSGGFGRLRLRRRLDERRPAPRERQPAESGALAGRIGPRREAELAEPIAQPMTVDRDRRPGEHPVDGRVAGVRRNQPGIRDERRRDATRRAGDARGGRGPETAVVADVDDLDPTVDRVRQAGGCPGDSPPRVVAWRADVVEQLAQRRSRRVAGGRRRRQQDLALAVAARSPRTCGSSSAIEPARITLSSGRRSRDRRDERGHVVERSPLVGAGRFAGAEEHGVDARVEDRRRHRQRVGRPGTQPATTRQPVRRAASSSGATARSDAAIAPTAVAARCGAMRRGRSRRPRPGRSRGSERAAGRPARTGSSSSRTMASTSMPAAWRATRSGATDGEPGRRARRTRWRRPGRGRGRLSGRVTRHATPRSCPRWRSAILGRWSASRTNEPREGPNWTRIGLLNARWSASRTNEPREGPNCTRSGLLNARWSASRTKEPREEPNCTRIGLLNARWSASRTDRPQRRGPPLGVPGDLFVQLLEPGDQLLDPRIVREDLRRAREARRRTGPAARGRRTASRSRRAADTAGSPGGSAPQGRSGRAAGSRGRPARRARRAAPRLARTGGSRDAPLARPAARKPQAARRRGERDLERVVGRGAAHREDHVLDRRRSGQLVADRFDCRRVPPRRAESRRRPSRAPGRRCS